MIWKRGTPVSCVKVPNSPPSLPCRADHLFRGLENIFEKESWMEQPTTFSEGFKTFPKKKNMFTASHLEGLLLLWSQPVEETHPKILLKDQIQY